MRPLPSLVLAGCLVVAAAPIGAATNLDTGKELLEVCREALEEKAPSRWQRNPCVGFVAGFRDGYLAAEARRPDSERTVCIPAETSTARVIREIVTHLEANPARLGEPKAGLAAEAVRKAFPCGKGGE